MSGDAAAVDQTSGGTVTTELTVKPPSLQRGGAVLGRADTGSAVRINTRRRRGRWKVRGEFSIGASFGTDWTTIDGCSETTTIVRQGRVKVFDRAKRRTVVVRAGHRYVARRGRSPGYAHACAGSGSDVTLGRPKHKATSRLFFEANRPNI